MLRNSCPCLQYLLLQMDRSRGSFRLSVHSLIHWQINSFILRSAYDRSIAPSRASCPQSAISRFLFQFAVFLFSLRSSSSCFRFSLLHIPSTLSPVMRCRPSGLQTTFISYGLSHRRHSHLRHYFNSGPRDSSFSDSYFLGLSRMAQTLFPICKVSLPFLSSHSLTLFRAYIFYFNIDLES